VHRYSQWTSGGGPRELPTPTKQGRLTRSTSGEGSQHLRLVGVGPYGHMSQGLISGAAHAPLSRGTEEAGRRPAPSLEGPMAQARGERDGRFAAPNGGNN
jgi:hypothetical protein